MQGACKRAEQSRRHGPGGGPRRRASARHGRAPRPQRARPRPPRRRFVCRRALGGRQGDPAVYLTPVPTDAVVYGSGDAARILTKEQAAARRRAGPRA